MTPREIYTHIGPVVRNNSEQMPLCRPIKMTGDMGGEFVFILASSGAIAVKPEKKAALRVRANVSGAKVWLGNVEKGTAPLTFEDIRPGTYRVKVVLDGYDTYQEEVRVNAGEASEVSAYLEKINTGPEPGPVME